MIKSYRDYIFESDNIDDISLVRDCFLSIIDDIHITFKKYSDIKTDIEGIQVNIIPKIKGISTGKTERGEKRINRVADISNQDILNIKSCIHLCSEYNNMEILFVRIIHKNPNIIPDKRRKRYKNRFPFAINNQPSSIDIYFRDIDAELNKNEKEKPLSEFSDYIDSIGNYIREIIIVFKN